jgi:hypothetical protein
MMATPRLFVGNRTPLTTTVLRLFEGDASAPDTGGNITLSGSSASAPRNPNCVSASPAAV